MFEVPVRNCTYCNVGKVIDLFVCGACAARFDDALSEVDTIEQELPFIIAGLTKVRVDGPSVSCSKINAPDVLNIAALHAQEELNNALVAFAKRIEDDPTSAQLTWLWNADGTHIKDVHGNNAYTMLAAFIPSTKSVGTLANWARGYIEWLLGEESAADDMADLMKAINAAKRFVMAPVERVTYGECNTPLLLNVEGARCSYVLSTVVGAESIHCKACGNSWTVAERIRERLSAKVLDHEDTAANVARILTRAKVKGVHTKRIIEFKRRDSSPVNAVGSLAYHVVTSHGGLIERHHDLFRVGDVLDEVIRLANKKAGASSRRRLNKAGREALSLAA